MRFVSAPAGSEKHALSADEAMATYKAVNGEFHPSSEPTPYLGLFTDRGNVRANGTHPYWNRLAWGYTWQTTCMPPPIGPGQSPPSPQSSPCTAWLWLDARTGKMILELPSISSPPVPVSPSAAP
jgi:hypothetical protein